MHKLPSEHPEYQTSTPSPRETPDPVSSALLAERSTGSGRSVLLAVLEQAVNLAATASESFPPAKLAFTLVNEILGIVKVSSLLKSSSMLTYGYGKDMKGNSKDAEKVMRRLGRMTEIASSDEESLTHFVRIAEP